MLGINFPQEEQDSEDDFSNLDLVSDDNDFHNDFMPLDAVEREEEPATPDPEPDVPDPAPATSESEPVLRLHDEKKIKNKILRLTSTTTRCCRKNSSSIVASSSQSTVESPSPEGEIVVREFVSSKDNN